MLDDIEKLANSYVPVEPITIPEGNQYIIILFRINKARNVQVQDLVKIVHHRNFITTYNSIPDVFIKGNFAFLYEYIYTDANNSFIPRKVKYTYSFNSVDSELDIEFCKIIYLGNRHLPRFDEGLRHSDLINV